MERRTPLVVAQLRERGGVRLGDQGLRLAHQAVRLAGEDLVLRLGQLVAQPIHGAVRGALDLRVRVQEVLVILVAVDGGQQPAGQHRAGGLLVADVRLGETGQAAQQLRLGETGLRGVVDLTEDDVPGPVHRETTRVAAVEPLILTRAEHQARAIHVGGGGLRRRGGVGRVNAGDALGVAAAGGGQHRGARAHAVPGETELRGGHRNLTGAQAHARQNLDGGLQVVGQAAMIRDEPVLRVRGGHRDAPGRQVAQGGVVILHRGTPIMAEGDARQALALGGRVHHAGQADVGKVADQDTVRSTLGQVRDEGLEISHVASISASVNAVWPSGAKRVPRFTGAARRTTGFPRPDSPGPRAEPPGPRAPATGESRPPRAEPPHP